VIFEIFTSRYRTLLTTDFEYLQPRLGLTTPKPTQFRAAGCTLPRGAL